MTSEASDLPDWKDQIPWCLAAEVDNCIFTDLLATPGFAPAWRRDHGLVFGRNVPRTGSQVAGRTERAWEKSWLMINLINRIPSLRTRVPSLAPQGTSSMWWMMKSQDHQVRKEEEEGTWEAWLVKRNGYKSQEGVSE